MTVRMLQRRGTDAEWQAVASTLVLQEGEVGYETTSGKFKIGDGDKTWSELEYVLPDNQNELKYAQLSGGNTLSGNQGITGNVSVSGNISTTGTITASSSISAGGEINANSHKIIGVSTPTSDTDAANKLYVDNAVSGLAWKEAVNLLATSDVALTGNTGTLIIDGHSALTQAHGDGYRILLTNQTPSTENGIYVYSDNGTTYSMSRSSDANEVSDLIGASVYVQDGTTYITSSWVQTSYNANTFDDLVWVQFSGAALITDGAGLLKNGNTLSVIGTADRISVTPDNVDIDANYVGQTSITTVGTVTTGTWSADTVAVNKGGTGATSAADARANLGLTSIATANYGTTSGTVAEGDHNHNSLYYTKSLTDELLSGYVHTASSSTISGTLTANNYNISVYAETSDNVTLDFSGGTGLSNRIAGGTVTLFGSNYIAGAIKTLVINNSASGSARTLVFPSGWVFLGTKPTTIAANKVGVLTVTSMGNSEASCIAGWAVQN